MKTLTKPTKDKLIEAYKNLGKEGHILTINEEALTASLDRVSKRSSLGIKHISGYGFKSKEKLLDYVTSYYNDQLEKIKKDKRKEKQKQQSKAEEAAAIKEEIFPFIKGNFNSI